MNEYTTPQIRNVAIAGHSGSGKTSILESILFNTKVTDRLGRVEDGNTVSDYDVEEVRRQVSINTSLIPVEYQGHKINFLDVPGTRDFLGEIRNALRVADALIIVVDASGGVEVGTELAYEYAEEFNLPRMFVINKINRERASFQRTLDAIAENFGTQTVLLNFPVGEAADFKGCVNLLKMKLSRSDGGPVSYEEIPAELADRARDLQAKLVEAAAEGDDELMAKFLEGETLNHEEVLRGLKEDLLEHKITPIITATATDGPGCLSLLDFVAQCFPAPGEHQPFAAKNTRTGEELIVEYKDDDPLAAFVFKTINDPFAGHLTFFKVLAGQIADGMTVLNAERGHEERVNHLMTLRGKKHEPTGRLHTGDIGVLAKLTQTHTGDTLCHASRPLHIDGTPMPPATVHMALVVKNKDEEEKVGTGIHRLIEQDPTLALRRDPETHQSVLSGMGDTHLDVAVSRLRTQHKVEIELTVPRVPYRETITRRAKGQGKHKKQSGGRGQYGDCWIELEPLTEGGGFQFEWGIVGGVIPTKYQPSVEKGLVQALERGIVSGHPAVDIKARCYDGSHHSVDSSDMAFQIAASKAFKKVAKEAGPVVLEPVYQATVHAPEQYMGDVMGDLNSRRGKILGIDSNGRRQVITALVPLAELYTYSKTLKSITHGRGTFEMAYHHYERVPADQQEKIVAAAAGEAEEEED